MRQGRRGAGVHDQLRHERLHHDRISRPRRRGRQRRRGGRGKQFDSLGVKHVLCVIQERGNVDLENYCASVKSTFSGQYTRMYVNGTTDLSGTQQEIQAELASNPSIDAVFTLDAPIAPLAVARRGRDQPQGHDRHLDAVAAGSSEYRVRPNRLRRGPSSPTCRGTCRSSSRVEYAKDSIRPSSAVLTGPNFVTKANAAQVVALSKKGMR